MEPVPATPEKPSDEPESPTITAILNDKFPFFCFPHTRSNKLTPTHCNKLKNFAPYLVNSMRTVFDEKTHFLILLGISAPPRVRASSSPTRALISLWKDEITEEMEIRESVIFGTGQGGVPVDLDSYFIDKGEWERTMMANGGVRPMMNWMVYKSVEYEVMQPGERTFEEYMDVILKVKFPEELRNGGLYGWLNEARDALKAEGLISEKLISAQAQAQED